MLRGRGRPGAIPAAAAAVQSDPQCCYARSQRPGTVGEAGAAKARCLREPAGWAAQPHQHREQRHGGQGHRQQTDQICHSMTLTRLVQGR